MPASLPAMRADDNEWVTVEEAQAPPLVYGTMQRKSSVTAPSRPANNNTMASGRATLIRGSRPARMAGDETTPSYWVEHLATFAVGKQFGLEWPADGIHKLRQMERNSAIWAQPMILRLTHDFIVVEDENGELVEQFALDLVAEPTAHLSVDTRDIYNNIVLFIVREDKRAGSRTNTPTEMHIFQCNRVNSQEVVDDIIKYKSRQFAHVPPGRRDTGFQVTPAVLNNGVMPRAGDPTINSYTRTQNREVRGSRDDNNNSRRRRRSSAAGHSRSHSRGRARVYDDNEGSSDSGGDYFEHDVNTLNRCFDDIERFAARIQSAALAQKELEQMASQRRSGRRSRSHGAPDPGLLSMRAQLPSEMEFADIFAKFKLSFNLLARLRDHIYEPNASELVHFLFTPLTLILDATHWGIGKSIATQVVSPLLTRNTINLLRSCLSAKELDVWMSLGPAWFTPPEEWQNGLPMPYRPVFADGYMPYGPPLQPIYYPGTQGAYNTMTNRRMAHSEIGNVSADIDRMSIKEREREIRAKQHEIKLEKKNIELERQRLESEKRNFADYVEKASFNSEQVRTQQQHDHRVSSPSTTLGRQGASPSLPNLPQAVITIDSPRQRQFCDDLRARGAKIVQSNYDRVGLNHKELTVSRGEYLEVLNDQKNWWECRNIQNRVGFVPHTILNVIAAGADQRSTALRVPNGQQLSYENRPLTEGGRITVNGGGSAHQQQSSGSSLTNGQVPNGALVPEDAPEYVKKRQGKRGEFRYF